jgi:DNA-3-methyladenine glycosylase
MAADLPVPPNSGAPRAPHDFFARDPITLARLLIGQRLVRILDDGTRLAGTIVETEAYLGVKDAAAHSVNGRRTPRNEAMYGPPGTAYVYFTYGMHYCMNVVCGAEGEPVAVLLRALEPTEGIEPIRAARMAARLPRRATMSPALQTNLPIPRLNDRELCSGPARLCQALQIDRRHNLIDLAADSRLWIEVVRPGLPPRGSLVNTPRIGVDYAGPWAVKPLRWFLRSSIHVSRPSGG